MPPLNVRQLEAFRATMLCGSVTGAGEMLRLTQPSVSKLLSQLEAHTGIRLFDRVRGRLVPRAEANALFEEVDRAFAVLEETARNARRLSRGSAGHLRIVATAALGLDTLPQVIGRFLSDRPEATVEFNIRSSSYVEEWVSGHRCDLGLSTARPKRDSVASEVLISAPAVCVLPAGHRLAGSHSLRPEDLKDERFISLSRETELRGRIDAVFDISGVDRKNVVESGYACSACALAAAGVGVTVVDPFTALAAAKTSGIDVVAFDPAIPFTIYALTPRHKPQPGLLVSFMDDLRAEAASDTHHLAQMLGGIDGHRAETGGITG
nr:LysR family transcriptional regulator [Rhizobium sp. Q54]